MPYLRLPSGPEIERLKDLILEQLRANNSFHPTLILSLGCLAELRQKRREYDKAERIYRRALELYNLLPRPHPPVLSVLLTGYLRLLEVMGRSAEAARVAETQRRLGEHGERLTEWEWEAARASPVN
jgi:tetratricopeptide (TPR) repeat protein